MISDKEAAEFIDALSEPVLKPLINDWYNNQYTIEQFVAHVFISGVMFAGTVKEMQEKQEGALEIWDGKITLMGQELDFKITEGK